MRLPASSVAARCALAPLVLVVAACYHETPVDTAPASQLMEPARDGYVAAPADSCQRAQQRAESAPVFKVMREPAPYRTNEKPPFPLRERVGGYQQVTVQFLVAPTGRVDMANVKVISSSGPRFEESVRTVMPGWRFTPAELVPGCRVWFRVTMPVVFHTPPMAGTR
jgi:TonB family protein